MSIVPSLLTVVLSVTLSRFALGRIRDHVACGIVGEAVEVIVCADNGVKGVAGPRGNGLVGAIAPRIIRPRQAGAAGGVGGRRQSAEAIEGVIGVAAIEDLVGRAGHGGEITIIGDSGIT